LRRGGVVVMVACLSLDPEEEDLEMPLDGDLEMEIGGSFIFGISFFFLLVMMMMMMMALIAMDVIEYADDDTMIP
jgi:hypothetical protein